MAEPRQAPPTAQQTQQQPTALSHLRPLQEESLRWYLWLLRRCNMYLSSKFVVSVLLLVAWSLLPFGFLLTQVKQEGKPGSGQIGFEHVTLSLHGTSIPYNAIMNP